MNKSAQKRRASWWRLYKQQRLSPVALAELARIKAILAGGDNGKH